MRSLSVHVARMRAAYPDDELAVVFDIDGTIVDTRHLVVHVLLTYDRHHGTDHFQGITVEDVDRHETDVDGILERFPLPDPIRTDVRSWYLDHFRDEESIAASHRPYQGVLSVIRWFQLQPRTHIALNTGRPEWMRQLTLASLNALGRVHRVVFEPEMLFMNHGTENDVAEAKVQGLRRLVGAGYRPVAVIDNEPAMISAMAKADAADKVLFLHADTLFTSRREPTPRTVSGSTYGLSDVVDEAELGRRVTLVWHGVNDRHNLEQFMASKVRWGELDVRRDPLGRVVLRHDSFLDSPWSPGEPAVRLDDTLGALALTARSVKLDLKEGEGLVDDVLDIVRSVGLSDDRLWFNGSIEVVGRTGLRTLKAAHPLAILQCPVDFLVPLLLAAPASAEDVLKMLAGWGGVSCLARLADAGCKGRPRRGRRARVGDQPLRCS
jgi:phosphoglycolate phosphatase-like HAD superfamily hydrolase